MLYESYLVSSHFDLITPDGWIEKVEHVDETHAKAWVKIQNISPAFLGFQIDLKDVFFNAKSVLAQLGLDGIGEEYALSSQKNSAEIQVLFTAYNDLARSLLPLLSKGMYVGKLFAMVHERKVRNPDYLTRMFGRFDNEGRPLLSLGGSLTGEDFILEKTDGHTIAFLPLKAGIITYDSQIFEFLPTLAKALHQKHFSTRQWLHLHQLWQNKASRKVQLNEMLLVRTAPLHIRTVFAKVADHMLPSGYRHTSACVLQPDTFASGDIYEFFGSSDKELKEVPLEFYTLEPHREYVFFADRDQLRSSLEKPEVLFKVFETAPHPKDSLASVFIVKGSQLESLAAKDWVVRNPKKEDFVGTIHPARQIYLVDQYIKQQPAYPFLKAIESGLITSEGVLFSRFFPTPFLKSLILGSPVQKHLRAIYFQIPSRSYGYYFSHEDRSFLFDLASFAISVFWIDEISGKILKYVVKPNKETGMFVPLHLVETFRQATMFGVYGSNLLEGNFEAELKALLQGVLDMRVSSNHTLLSPETPLALLTGGGPGSMEVGNRVAQELSILSCGNIVDFRATPSSVINEQQQNAHVEAKMTYRLDRLIERQAEFHLDFPIFLMGGYGTDFEYALEEVRRKVGSCSSNPVLLFGEPAYWKEKISHRFQGNLRSGAIRGSEWVSNCFYCVQTAEQGLKIYQEFFNNHLPIGKTGPIFPEGFCSNFNS